MRLTFILTNGPLFICATKGLPWDSALHNPPQIGFAGPYLINDTASYWSEEHLIDLDIRILGRKEPTEFDIKQFSQPGLLVQELLNDLLHVTLKLFYHDAEQVVVKVAVQNLSSNLTPVEFKWNTNNLDNAFILNFPPAEKNTLPIPTKQRVNFLQYENRQFQWTLLQNKATYFRPELIKRPKLDHPFQQNCERWLQRTKLLRPNKHLKLATQCLETVINRHSVDTDCVRSVVERLIEPNWFTTEHPPTKEPLCKAAMRLKETISKHDAHNVIHPLTSDEFKNSPLQTSAGIESELFFLHWEHLARYDPPQAKLLLDNGVHELTNSMPEGGSRIFHAPSSAARILLMLLASP